MKKQKIKITKVPVDTDPRTEVYQVEIVEAPPGNGSWMETFNTLELLNAFLRGLRVATTMLGGTFSMESCWEFEADSCIDRLP